MKKKTLMLFVTFILLIGAYSVLAQTTVPEAPTTFDELDSTRRNSSAVPDQTIEAIAGNITSLNMHGNTVTRTWFGVYGNVTGTLTLSNGANQVMYNWSVANPRGQVYATTAPDKEGTILWNEVECYSYENTDGGYYSLSELNADLGINGSVDQDSVDRTFRLASDFWDNDTLSYDAHYHDEFFVGTKYIENDTCPATAIIGGAGQEWNRFQEVLLYNHGHYLQNVSDPANEASVIYTGLIENEDIEGFDNSLMDFQMLLGEDGHEGDTSTTTYYFYVELE